MVRYLLGHREEPAVWVFQHNFSSSYLWKWLLCRGCYCPLRCGWFGPPAWSNLCYLSQSLPTLRLLLGGLGAGVGRALAADQAPSTSPGRGGWCWGTWSRRSWSSCSTGPSCSCHCNPPRRSNAGHISEISALTHPLLLQCSHCYQTHHHHLHQPLP